MKVQAAFNQDEDDERRSARNHNPQNSIPDFMENGEIADVILTIYENECKIRM